MAGVFRDLATPSARSYAGTISRDKGTTGGVSSDQQVVRFFDRSENQPPLNPYHGRPVVDQTLGDQFGEGRYELNVGMQIRNLIRADAEQPWFTLILPLRQSDELTVTGTIWKYNRRLPTPTPYHAPSPYVTEQFEEFYGQLQRYGESIRMESDFFHTPEGQQNFFLKLTGIASDMVEGIRFDVMRELLRSIDQNKRYYHNHTYTENPMKDIMMRVQLFATLNKAPTKTHTLGIITERLERVLNEYVPGPYEMIVPPEWGIWMNKVNQTPVSQPYFLQGDDGGQLFIRNGPTPKGSIGRNNFWEYQDVTVETGSLPLRMLQRPVSVAEYYRALFVERNSDLFSMLTGLLASEKNVGRMRNLYVYSLTENKYIEVRVQDMIQHSGLVPGSYKEGNDGAHEYIDLVNEYRRLGTAARSKFYPEEKSYPSGHTNHANQREAPMFLAWEPKGSAKGDYFIRVKYSGETDENVTGADDHANQGQVICAHLVKTYGLDQIGAHYANAFGIRRKIQMTPDNIAYWNSFYLENIYYSLTGIRSPRAGFYSAILRGTSLSEAADYARYSERWGQQPFDTVGELTPQPGGHYLIPTYDTEFGSISLPPGCDCPMGIRSICEISTGSGWNEELVQAVRNHENALLSMVEMAKKLPESELVNPLNRDPWVHSPELGAFATAYTNGVSQFRAPIFLNGYTTLSITGGNNLQITGSSNAYRDGNRNVYARDPLLRALRIAGVPAPGPTGGPRSDVDPVTGSLGVDDDDEPMDTGLSEPDETILQGMLRDYFVSLQSENANIDTSFERSPTAAPRRARIFAGLMYVVTYFTNETAAGTFNDSHVRAVYIGNRTLNTTDEDVASQVMEVVRAVIEETSEQGSRVVAGAAAAGRTTEEAAAGALNDTHIVYIGSRAELNMLGGRAVGLTVPDESIGTVGGRLNATFDREGTFQFDPSPAAGTRPIVTRLGDLADGRGFYAISDLRDVETRMVVSLENYVEETAPFGVEAIAVLASTSAGTAPLGFQTTGSSGYLLTSAGTGASTVGFPIRCGLVMTPGMIKAGTYRNSNSRILVGNKATGYTTPILNAPGSSDPHATGLLERSPLAHGLTSIMSKIGGNAYLEWETGSPRHHSHFSYNQVNARLAGMDDEGMFSAQGGFGHGSGYYRDDDEEDEDSMEFRVPHARSGARAHGMLGSRRRGNSFSSSEDNFGSEEGAGSWDKELEHASAHIGAKQPRSYYEGAYRRGGTRRGRFGRRPFAHALDLPGGARFSEAHGRDLASSVRLGDGRLRKGYRMVQRLNGSNFVAKMGEITTDPQSPCTFFAIAAMMSRCDKLEHWMKLAKNKLHVASDFLLHRICEVYAESALLLKAGLGFTVVNNADYKNGEVTSTKTYHGHLTVHYGAFVTRPDYQLMLEDMRLTGYIGGKGGGMVRAYEDLDMGSSRRGSGRPSFICYSVPIAQKRLPQVLSLSGRFEMDDILPENMPVQGSLYGGTDWHNRRFRWNDLYTQERNSRDYFRTKGYAVPLVSFQGWQANYDLNEGLFKVYSRGEGHLAGGDYPGALHVVNGDEPYFDYPGDPNLF